MGLNVGSIYTANQAKSVIDTQALASVAERILNPNNEQTVDVSKLDLSKFNRVSLGTDLYAARTDGETALQAAKAAADFDINLSETFTANVQYLNSQAAQSLFTSKENTGKVTVNIENTQSVSEEQVVIASSQITETKDMNKDKRGSNPFSFYMPSQAQEEQEETDSIFGSINIFA